MKELDLYHLAKITGGNVDDCFAYWDKMIEKYGLAPEDYEGLYDVMTEEESDYASDLFWEGIDVDFSTFPGFD